MEEAGKINAFSDRTMVTINGVEYDETTFSDNAKAQLRSIVFVKNELARLENQMAVLRMAENGYFQALQKELDGKEESGESY